MQSLFRRCLECPEVTPSCPKCASDETCLLQSKSCDVCPNAKCVKVGSLPGQSEAKKASSTPVIAGGVVGGVVFIIVATFLIWWFCIRKRRQEWDEQVWTETDQSFSGVEKRDQGGLNRDARESTRSMGSIATAHTRASNVIQIAYIPGVTNRSPTESPGLLIPPVPPIPFGTTNTSTATSPNFEQDRHFFMPNLRDSTYSDLSSRQSLSPSLARASMSPTIYRNNAEVSPAVQALRGKAAVVTVNKSGNNSPADLSSPEDTSPSTPQAPKGLVNSSIVARNVTARPIQVKKSNSGKKSQVPTFANLKAATANKRVSLRPQQKIEEGSEDETDASTHLITTKKPDRQSTSGTVIDDTPAIKQSQFTNTSSSASSISEAYASPTAPRGSPQRSTRSGLGGGGGSSSSPVSGQLHKKNGSLNSLIEEAMTRAARDPVHGGLGSISENHNYTHNHPVSHWSESQTQGWSSSDSGTASVSPSVAGPFSDANEVRESVSRSTLS